jgi:hypothetical protein
MKEYQPAINELTKVKKFSEAMVLEDEVSDLLKTSRGYGFAFPALPDLESNAKPLFQIENKKTGLILDGTSVDGQPVFVPKMGKNKPSQCWLIERDEKGFSIRNVANKKFFHLPFAKSDLGAVICLNGTHPLKEPDSRSFFRISEVHREIMIGPAVNDLVLTLTEKTERGVTTVSLTQEKKEEMPLPTQLWTLTEVK